MNWLKKILGLDLQEQKLDEIYNALQKEVKQETSVPTNFEIVDSLDISKKLFSFESSFFYFILANYILFQLFLKKQHMSLNSCRAKIIVPRKYRADICYLLGRLLVVREVEFSRWQLVRLKAE